jgi:hypothetical protein
LPSSPSRAALESSHIIGAHARNSEVADGVPVVLAEVARPDFHGSRRAVVRMTGDAESTLAPDDPQDLLGRLIGADEVADVQADVMGVVLAAQVVLCDPPLE